MRWFVLILDLLYEVLDLSQGWKRNVRADLFAITLRGHFVDKLTPIYGPRDFASSAQADDWTLEYMNMSYLQQIKEAFDQDGSGWVTISDVNRFSESQPDYLGWRYVGSSVTRSQFGI